VAVLESGGDLVRVEVAVDVVEGASADGGHPCSSSLKGQVYCWKYS
jgi:hypothetical protein